MLKFDYMPDLALAYATVWHKGQKRKRTGLPYIVHPIHVVDLLTNGVGHNPYGWSAEFLSAAYLHDVIEDCKVSTGQITNIFGKTVSTLVWELTCPKFDNNKEKDEYLLESMLKMSSDALTIKLADRLDNVLDASIEGWKKYLSRTNKLMYKLYEKRELDKIQESLYTTIVSTICLGYE